MHSDRRKFDAEDERLMSTLGQFALPWRIKLWSRFRTSNCQITARERAEAAVRELANGLERQDPALG